MKRLMLPIVLLAVAVFVMPAYADPEPKAVLVVNAPDAAVPVQGDVQVTNTVDADANITNTAGNPVPVTVTNPSTGNAIIVGIARQDAEVNTPIVGTRYDLISLTGPGTFIGARVLGIGGSGPSQFTLQLEIDGNLIVDEFLSGLDTYYAPMNPMGIIRDCAVSGGMEGMCIGFIQPVAYRSNLTLSVTTAGAIDKVSGTVLYAE